MRLAATNRSALVPMPYEAQALEADTQSEHVGAASYRMLVGCDPADAMIDDDESFDRHVLASILAVAAMEGGAVAERAGLANNDLTKLIEEQFPGATGVAAAWCAQAEKPE